MILLDTNVVSEAMKVAPSAHVLRWLDEQNSDAVFVSAVTIGEIEYGLRILPDARELQARWAEYGPLQPMRFPANPA